MHVAESSKDMLEAQTAASAAHQPPTVVMHMSTCHSMHSTERKANSFVAPATPYSEDIPKHMLYICEPTQQVPIFRISPVSLDHVDQRLSASKQACLGSVRHRRLDPSLDDKAIPLREAILPAL